MDKRIEKAYDIIKRDFHLKLRLAELARRVKLSPFYFQKLFTRDVGVSPLEFLNRVRLERSAHLIRANTGQSMSTIASECGFSSLSSFSRAFSKRHGMSPQAFMQSGILAVKGILNSEGSPDPEVTVVYQPDIYVYYHVTSINNPQLLKEFSNVRMFCELNNIECTERNLGISTFVTFHYPHDERNYYAGVEIKGPVPEKFKDRVFFIPKGRFGSFATDYPITQPRESVMWFHTNWLAESKYLRRDLFGIEEFEPGQNASDFPRLKRRVFVPVKAK